MRTRWRLRRRGPEATMQVVDDPTSPGRAWMTEQQMMAHGVVSLDDGSVAFRRFEIEGHRDTPGGDLADREYLVVW